MSKYHIFETPDGKVFMADSGPRRGYYVLKTRLKDFINNHDFDFGLLEDYPYRPLIVPKEFT